MRDIYLMNKATGEIVPATEVISEFYKTHNYLENVFEHWIETELEVENTHIALPDFTNVF